MYISDNVIYDSCDNKIGVYIFNHWTSVIAIEFDDDASNYDIDELIAYLSTASISVPRLLSVYKNSIYLVVDIEAITPGSFSIRDDHIFIGGNSISPFGFNPDGSVNTTLSKDAIRLKRMIADELESYPLNLGLITYKIRRGLRGMTSASECEHVFRHLIDSNVTPSAYCQCGDITITQYKVDAYVSEFGYGYIYDTHLCTAVKAFIIGGYAYVAGSLGSRDSTERTLLDIVSDAYHEELFSHLTINDNGRTIGVYHDGTEIAIYRHSDICEIQLEHIDVNFHPVTELITEWLKNTQV